MEAKDYSWLGHFQPAARAVDSILQWEATEKKALLWADFSAMTECAGSRLVQLASSQVVLVEPDAVLFMAWLLAAVKQGLTVHIPGNQGSISALVSRYPQVGGVVPPVSAGSRVATGTKEATIVFHTSGSTGEPKAIEKKWSRIACEIQTLGALWGDKYQSSVVLSTVGHEHFYGFLFSAAVPLFYGGQFLRERIQYPETINQIDHSRKVLVSSPAFLKRCVDFADPRNQQVTPLVVYSSGGQLGLDIAHKTARNFACPILEIYGSTETGGIAWREHPQETLWHPFRNIALSQNEESALLVKSPYLEAYHWFPTGDLVSLVHEDKFELHGRIDSIVKIEEKRVSLAEVERLLNETGLVEDCAVISFHDTRQYLAGVLVLNQEGSEILLSGGKLAMNRRLVNILLKNLHPTVVPKKWRYCSSLPRNAQGKLSRASLEDLFKK